MKKSQIKISEMYPEKELNDLWLRFRDTDYFPTRLMNLIVDWNNITHQTEKAVQLDYEHWLPKSKIIIEDGKVIAMKKSFYHFLKSKSTSQRGF
jgi:hypothetical protein